MYNEHDSNTFGILSTIQKHELFIKQGELIKYQTRAMKLIDCFALNNDIYIQLVTVLFNSFKCLNSGTVNSPKTNTFKMHPFLI